VHLTTAASLAFTVWKSDIRHFLILFNIVALLALGAYLAWTVVRRSEERPPPNEVAFLSDEELEGRRLERVLAWSLVFVSVFAISFLVYWLREPTRQAHSETYFEEGSVERGQTLFANPASEHYDSVLSLQCANCHSGDGSGGSTPFVVDPDGPDGPAPPERHDWKAPPLNTVLLRFQEDEECAQPAQRPAHVCEVSDIITYGRPGTPMQPFGTAGGGAENNQTISDIVSYLRSIQLTPEEAKRQAADELEAAQGAAENQVDAAREALEGDPNADPPTTGARGDLDTARAALVDALGGSPTTDSALQTRCEDLAQQALDDPASVDDALAAQGGACRTYLDAVDAVEEAEAALAWAEQWRDLRADATDGQFLFELYCARCHTEGWSVFDPTVPDGTDILGEPGGGGGAGGGIGFNLRDGSQQRRFGDGEPGRAAQLEFINTGSEAFKPYGRGGIGSGKMPGFADMLEADMIEQIVDYERDDLDSTSYDVPNPVTTPTTTTGG
jgi:mono/diheme cytochrome c family protein